MIRDDEKVINGFRSFDADITKEYFYGYCRRAYNVLDSKYQLHNKVGLDFYSLAHEYYMQLLLHDFRQLQNRPKNMKLSSFMFKGFWFVTMDALKAHNKEVENTTDADVVLQYVRSTDREDGMMEQVAEAVSHHYHDRVMAHIAWEIFVLGYKQKEIGEEMGMTPSAVNQRYKKMMEEVVTPFVIENYGRGIYFGNAFSGFSCKEDASVCYDRSIFAENTNPDMAESADDSMNTHENMWDKIMRRMINKRMKNKETDNMKANRITPNFITSLKENEVFVFGSNLRGAHAGGAARTAYQHFGAIMGQGVGMQGQSYAIPSMQGGVETIRPYVDDFITYAKEHSALRFYVTPIGCGIAGFEPKDIAPLFKMAKDLENVYLPESFWSVID